VVIAAILALLVGLSLGLLGGGGSILTLPVLVYVVGLPPRDGIAASLLIVGVTSASAMLGHARAGRVRWSIGALFGAASMLGAFGGGRLSHLVPAAVLLGGFTFLMLVTALAMMRPRSEVESGAAPSALRGGALARVLAVGVGIGLLTGVVGAGGGFVIVPALALLCALPMRAAVGTSLLVITVNSFAGFAGAAAHATIPWRVVGVMTGSAVIGSFGGAALTTRVSPASLRKGFAWFVLAMTAFMVWKQIPAQLIVMTSGFSIPVAIGVSLIAAALVALVVTLRRRRRSLSEAP
jgi:hypothetical protein